MRHSTIDTTLRYYVDLDADDVARELWAGFGNTSGNTPTKEYGDEQDAVAATADANQVLTSGGHGARTRNRFPGTTFPVWLLTIRLPSGSCLFSSLYGFSRFRINRFDDHFDDH